MSGRRRAQVHEDARLLGQSSYIYEAGACVVLDGEEHWLTGELLPGRADDRRADRALGRPGAAARALQRAPGVPRAVARRSARSRTCSAGWWTPPRPTGCWPSTATGTCGWSTTAWSAAARRRWPRCRTCAATTCCPPAPPRPAAVAFHRRARGYAREETFAVGDSREDLACAPQVGRLLAGRQRARARPVDAARRSRPTPTCAVDRGRARGGRVRGGAQHRSIR